MKRHLRPRVAQYSRGFTVLVFIDESGCPGMKLGSGATEFSTVAMVLLENAEDAARAELAIAELRNELRFREDFEFHFNKLRPEYRVAFLNAIAPLPFRWVSTTISKRHPDASVLQNSRDMYRFACALALREAKPFLHAATLVFDGRGSPAFQREVASDLRRQVNDSKDGSFIAKIKFQESHRNDLLQMADMVCGSVARFWNGKADGALCRQRIANNEISCELWP